MQKICFGTATTATTAAFQTTPVLDETSTLDATSMQPDRHEKLTDYTTIIFANADY